MRAPTLILVLKAAWALVRKKFDVLAAIDRKAFRVGAASGRPPMTVSANHGMTNGLADKGPSPAHGDLLSQAAY